MPIIRPVPIAPPIAVHPVSNASQLVLQLTNHGDMTGLEGAMEVNIVVAFHDALLHARGLHGLVQRVFLSVFHVYHQRKKNRMKERKKRKPRPQYGVVASSSATPAKRRPPRDACQGTQYAGLSHGLKSTVLKSIRSALVPSQYGDSAPRSPDYSGRGRGPIGAGDRLPYLLAHEIQPAYSIRMDSFGVRRGIRVVIRVLNGTMRGKGAKLASEYDMFMSV